MCSANFTLHLGGYDLRGLYSLEEYYARNLGGYYEALTVGPSHNYYEGRAKASITKWVEYFCAGGADSFESVKRRAAEAASSGAHDCSLVLRRLDPRQRKALVLFQESDFIASSNVAELFSISERAARNLLTAWVADGFVAIAAQAKKSRKYELSDKYKVIFTLVLAFLVHI
jgi:hypothetical protein